MAEEHTTDTVRIAEVYLCRGPAFLILQRASGRGRGFWMVAGGVIEPGESPDDAARRETIEETGLRAGDLELLRAYRVRQEGDAYVREITSFIAEAPEGDVTLSDEHTAFAWITPAEYIDRYCSEAVEAALPASADIVHELRATCALVAAWMEHRAVSE